MSFLVLLEAAGTFAEFDEIVRDNVELMFGDWPDDQGIGSSDMGACCRAVAADLGLIQNSGDFAGYCTVDADTRMSLRDTVSMAICRLMS